MIETSKKDWPTLFGLDAVHSKNLQHFNSYNFSWQNSFGVFDLVCKGNRCLLIKYQVSFSTRDDLKTSKLPRQCPITKKKKKEKQNKQQNCDEIYLDIKVIVFFWHWGARYLIVKHSPCTGHVNH